MEFAAVRTWARRAWSPSGPVVAVAVCLCAIPALLWPADAPFINDEPQLLARALDANDAHRLATVGLMGTRAMPYGPLPTWIYQALLSCSHHVPSLVAVRALLVMCGVAVGLDLLARSLGVPRALFLLPLASPYLWFYARALWDNTFLLPLGAMCAGAYATFLRRRGRAALLGALACALLMPLVHLMALAWVLPFAVHVAWFARRELWREKWFCAALVVAYAALAAPYGYELLDAHRRAPRVPVDFDALSGTTALYGGRVLSAIGLECFFEESWSAICDGSWPVRVARWLTGSTSVACWAGMILAVVELVRAPRPWGPRPQLLLLMLGALAGQALLDAAMALPPFPHYQGANWPAFAAFTWLSYEKLSARRALRWVPYASFASLVVVLLAVIAGVHDLGGTRGAGYGPVVGDQITVARQLKRYPATAPRIIEVANFRAFPWGMDLLGKLEPAAGPPLHASRLSIEYTGRGGHVVVRADGAAPPAATP